MMDPKTQRSIAGFVVFAGALMIGGVILGDRVALPAALRFLTNYDNSLYNVQLRAADFISFAVLVLAACGAVFELPIAVLGLVRVKALSSAKLRRNRRMGLPDRDRHWCCAPRRRPRHDRDRDDPSRNAF